MQSVFAEVYKLLCHSPSNNEMSTPCYTCTQHEEDDSQPVPPVVADVESSPRPKKKAKPVIQHTKSLWERRKVRQPPQFNIDHLHPNHENDSPPWIYGTMGSVMGCPKDREFQARKQRQEQLENEMEEQMYKQEPDANMGRWLGDNDDEVIVLSSDASSDSSSSNSSSIEYDSD